MGELHGKGKIKKASGEEYEGDWVLNIREGEGRLRTSEGAEIIGIFKAHHPNGEVSIKHPNGD